MKTKRGLLSLLLVVAMVCSLGILPANAISDSATLILTPIEAMPGEEFSTTLCVAEGSEIVDFQIELLYDSDLVHLVSAKQNKDSDGDAVINSKQDGVLKINYTLTSENTDEEMPIADLVFEVDDNAGIGSYDFLKENPNANKSADRLEGSNMVSVPLKCDFDELCLYATGDIDLNKQVEIRDVTYLRRYLVNLQELSNYQLRIADAYYDEDVNIRDAVYIQQFLADFDVDPGNRANVYFYAADGTLIATKSVLRGEQLSKIPSVPAVDGQVNGAWSVAANELVEPDFSSVAKDMNVYAVYEEEVLPDEDIYSIDYHVYDNQDYLQQVGVGNENPAVYSSKTGLKLVPLTAEGYKFKGWYDAPGDSAKEVTEIKAGETGNKTLYAHWETIEYKVQYDCGEQAIVNQPAGKYTVDEGLVLPTLEWFGYNFVGWSDAQGHIVKAINKGTTGNITLYANWTSKRNQTKPVKNLGDPIVLEEDGQILFAYKLGDIENVPLFKIKDLGNAGGITVEHQDSVSGTISETNANTIAETISNSTTKSTAMTLSKGWNQTTNISESHLSESGLSMTEAQSLMTQQGGTWSLNESGGGSEVVLDSNGNSSTTKNEDTTHADATISAEVSEKASAEAGVPGAKASAEVSAKIGASATAGIGNTYSTSDLDESSHAETNTKTWNTNKGYTGSHSTSQSSSTSKTLSQKISDTYQYGKSITDIMNESVQEGLATSTTEGRQYSSTLSYSNSETVTSVSSYSNANAPDGYYRLVCAGTVHVFGVVGYDIATGSYYIYTYSVLDDEVKDYIDYSKTSPNFNDYENGVLPFEVPYEVEEYVNNTIAASNGLQVDIDTGTITRYTGSDKVVIIPDYMSIDNQDGKSTAVKVTGISSNAFKGNENIVAVKLSKYITGPDDNSTGIPASAFEGCTSLRVVDGNGVQFIGEKAFKGCTNLEPMVVTEGVTGMGNSAFAGVPSIEIDASNADVLKAATTYDNNWPSKLIIKTAEMTDEIKDYTISVPDSVNYFEFNGDQKTFSGLRIISDAASTVINGVTFADNKTTPLELSSENVTLNRVNVNARGLGLLLKADETNVHLFGAVNINSASNNAIITKNMVLSEVDPKVASKMNVSGNVLVCGEITGQDLLNVSPGEIKYISLEDYERIINGTYTMYFNPNGGTCDEESRVVEGGSVLDTLPTPTRTGYTFVGWYTAETGGIQISEENYEEVSSSIVSPDVAANGLTLYAHWNTDPYKLTFSNGTGYTVAVKRTSSPNANASTGALSSGATVYYGDVLSVTYTAATGYTIKSHGNTSITVVQDVTANDIYASATANTYTYNIKYQSVNGTNLGTSTVSGKFGTSTTVSAPAKGGYNTPASQTVKFDSTTAKTITFKYGIASVANGAWVGGGNWWVYNGDPKITYAVYAEYGTRTANTVQVRLHWVNTLKANSWYGYAQYCNGAAGGVGMGDYQLTTNSTWNSGVSYARSAEIYTNWVTVSASATTRTVGVSGSWWDNDGRSGSWSGTMNIPTY